MGLSGVSQKCKKCSQKCKQWKEVEVLVCPKYKPYISQAQQNGKEASS